MSNYLFKKIDFLVKSPLVVRGCVCVCVGVCGCVCVVCVVWVAHISIVKTKKLRFFRIFENFSKCDLTRLTDTQRGKQQ